MGGPGICTGSQHRLKNIGRAVEGTQAPPGLEDFFFRTGLFTKLSSAVCLICKMLKNLQQEVFWLWYSVHLKKQKH